jgi:hypothetical protein
MTDNQTQEEFSQFMDVCGSLLTALQAINGNIQLQAQTIVEFGSAVDEIAKCLRDQLAVQQDQGRDLAATQRNVADILALARNAARVEHAR